MVRAENLIVSGKCFIRTRDHNNPETIAKLKGIIAEYMTGKGYATDEHPVFNQGLLTITFSLKRPQIEFSKFEKLRMNLGLTNREKLTWRNYANWLETKRTELPCTVTFILSPSKLKEEGGLAVEIKSTPIIYFLLSQMEAKFQYDEFQYSNILHTNKELIYDFMKAVHSEILAQPKVISDLSEKTCKNSMTDTLEKYGMKRIAEILSEGYAKINRGDAKEAIDDLRGALEMFTKKIADRVDNKNLPQDKIEENINVLSAKGMITGKMAGILIAIYRNTLYSYFSDNTSHKRENMPIRDAKFFFSLIEDYMDYIISKVIQ